MVSEVSTTGPQALGAGAQDPRSRTPLGGPPRDRAARYRLSISTMLLFTTIPASAMMPIPAHDDPEGSPGDDQSDQHARDREDDGAHHDHRLAETVELGDEDEEHQRDRRCEGANEKFLRLRLVLRLAGEGPRDGLRQIRLLQSRTQGADALIHEQSRRDVGFDGDHAALIQPLDRARARRPARS